jgi:flagellar motor switch protein FliN/FliY
MKSPATSPASKASQPADTRNISSAGPGLVSLDSTIFKDVQVELRARLGGVSLSIEELLTLKAGSVVRLDSKLDELIELRLNDSIVARGEIVAVGDNFGIRIAEIDRVHE